MTAFFSHTFLFTTLNESVMLSDIASSKLKIIHQYVHEEGNVRIVTTLLDEVQPYTIYRLKQLRGSEHF
jgi:hypothetical protein